MHCAIKYMKEYVIFYKLRYITMNSTPKTTTRPTDRAIRGVTESTRENLKKSFFILRLFPIIQPITE